MEQYIIKGTSSYSSLDANQHSSTETGSHYEISEIYGESIDIASAILPDKQYRVVAGQLYVVRQDSPPNPQS